MKGPSLTDLALLAPELILVGAALALILFARRIKNGSFVTAGTIVVAVTSAVFSGWIWADLPDAGIQFAFTDMIAVDRYSLFFKILIAASLAMCTLMSERRVDAGDIQPAEFHALLLLASTGMMLAVSALNLLTLYLGLELMTLCSYILVGITVNKPTANESAIKYFLLGSFASALFLYGISLTYGITGATDFVAIYNAISEHGLVNNPILLAAIGLLISGLAFKIAAFPFHAWAPDAYQGASAPVAAFLATASKAAGIAALGRVCLFALYSEAQVMSIILIGLASLSIIVGSIIALSQTEMKRLLAYSSIAHAGYALLGLIPLTPEGTSATMTYVFLYVFMTLGAFSVVIALGPRGEKLDGYQGLAIQRPGIAALMLLFLLALTGIPPTAGFVAKFVVIETTIAAGYWGLAIVAVLCSVISAFVYLRIAVLMYMNEPQETTPSRFPLAITAALAIAALVTVFGGLFPSLLSVWTAVP